jgi:hypothetical protein
LTGGLTSGVILKSIAEGLLMGLWIGLKSGGWIILLMVGALYAFRAWEARKRAEERAIREEERIRKRVRIEEDERERVRKGRR